MTIKYRQTARIWIEPVKRPDGRNWYSERNGLLLRTRHGGADGDILVERTSRWFLYARQ